MTDPLLRYYERELALVKRSLGFYAEEHSHIASLLDMHQGQIEDPSLARLLDGVALLNAKTEMALETQYSQVIDSLIDVIYPSINQRVPSIGYAELNAPDGITENANIPLGSQFSNMIGEQECLFQTVDNLAINPFSITDISATTAPFSVHKPEEAELANAALQIQLSTGDEGVYFSSLACSDLNFFVKGFANNADLLVELLLSNCLAISLSDRENNTIAELSGVQLQSRVGDPDFKFLPAKGNQFDGFQIIREFFLFKEKRQFFIIRNFASAISKVNDHQCTLNIFLNDIPSEFLRLFDTDVIRLNVVPVINTFEHISEPITVDGRRLAYPIQPNSGNDSVIDIIKIQSVKQITAYGDVELVPVLGDKYKHSKKTHGTSTAYWEAKMNLERQFEVVVSESLYQSENATLIARLLCCNDKLACSASGELECRESIDLPGVMTLMYPPSAPQDVQNSEKSLSQLIGLLTCNFNSLLQSDDPASMLKGIFKLFAHDAKNLDEINTINNVKFQTQVSTLRVHNKNVFVPGTEITVELNSEMPYHSFSIVMNEFFKQFCSFDRYIQLSVNLYGKPQSGLCFAKVHGNQLCL
ncbi:MULTISPECIES: type VI secretion system baseplate subunit TssF [Vibrio]|uniref:type VI secretion system baseplate subunit TssF n=1 Tax=Vibrio TaxID=662 RepID=UPI0001541DA7|nr:MULTISPECIES: type VI secretion system baseplate subunit TssF [Vibrio]EDL54258.1 hypothetical protein VSAK1_06060 [Vibrio mediterranei AK1]MCY9852704.1 type VI secretion system baseplate subunit TssF [Vibrio mediterranei]